MTLPSLRVLTIFKLLVFVLVSTTAQATMTIDPLNGLCDSTKLMASGSFKRFNEWQCRYAKGWLRTDVPQEGNSCVCEALVNVMHELRLGGDHGKAYTVREFAKDTKLKCENEFFYDVFHAFAKNDEHHELQGEVFGGALAALNSHRLTPADVAISRALSAVSTGRVVAMAMAPKPIYQYLMDRGLLPKDSVIRKTDRHAVLIRAVIKDNLGNDAYAVILDSNTPFPVYAVPVDVLRKAYKTVFALPARGVYISDAVRAWNPQ